MHAIEHPVRAEGLADILERVLDKGIVVAGDVSVSLVGIELLTIKLRLLITTVDKAMELGINWWESDPMLSSQAVDLEDENRRLRGRLASREKRMSDLAALSTAAPQAEPVENAPAATPSSDSRGERPKAWANADRAARPGSTRWGKSASALATLPST